MTEENFTKFLEHFKHIKPSKESPVLVLLDNHDSHLAVLDFANENYIVFLSFPPPQNATFRFIIIIITIFFCRTISVEIAPSCVTGRPAPLPVSDDPDANTAMENLDMSDHSPVPWAIISQR